MGVLVEDMLLLARLDQQRALERRPVDVLTLAADAVQDARMISPDREIGLTVGAGAAFIVLGDEPRLRQVIGNLMANALTHTPAGTPISVRISTAGPDEAIPVASVVLEVADTGKGMTPEVEKRLFDPFFTTKETGTGLGLSIAARILEKHGGSLQYQTQVNRGTTFGIVLPKA